MDEQRVRIVHKMLGIGGTFVRRIVLDANPRQPPLGWRKNFELIDLIVAAMLKQDAVELVMLDFVGRNVVHVVAE